MPVCLGVSHQKDDFPRRSVPYQVIRGKGPLFYDTGYHYDIKTKSRYAFYRLGRQFKWRDQIFAFAKRGRIEPGEINYVLLVSSTSRHLGGATFPNINFYPDPEVRVMYTSNRKSSLIF